MTSASVPPPTELRWQGSIATAVLDHLQAATPAEGVGLLATVDQGPAWRAVRFYPGRNADASRTRYTMDPADVLAALVDIERHGWRLGAIVHSHPTSPPTPSPTDLREAFYPDALMVIVSLRGPTPEVRAWWVGAAEPTAVPIRESP